MRPLQRNPVPGAEYIIVPAGQEPSAKDWANAKAPAGGQAAVEFGGLAPDTAYDVWGRMAETDDAAQSEAAKASVTTPKPSAELDAPAAAEGLVYDGSAQPLVSGGSAEGGTLLYALGDDADDAPATGRWSEEIPEATGAGTYHVWYRVDGDEGHEGVALGWFDEAASAAEAVAFPYEPAGSVTLKAHWKANSYTITFDSAGGTAVAPVSATYGARVDAPADPTRDGHVFAGWLNADGSAVAFPLDMPDTNPTFKAKWKAVQSVPAVEVEATGPRTVSVKDPVPGAEYVIVPAGQQPTDEDWAKAKTAAAGQGAVTFDGLEPDTSYDVWGRMAETDEAAQSDAAKASVKTPAEGQDEPQHPEVSYFYAGDDVTWTKGSGLVAELACVFVIVPAVVGLDPIAVLACDTATVYLALWHEWVLYHSRMKRLESDGE